MLAILLCALCTLSCAPTRVTASTAATAPSAQRRIAITSQPASIDSHTASFTVGLQWLAVGAQDSMVVEVLPARIAVGPNQAATSSAPITVYGRTVAAVSRGGGKASVTIKLKNYLPASSGEYRVRAYIYGTQDIQQNSDVARSKAHAYSEHVLNVVDQLPSTAAAMQMMSGAAEAAAPSNPAAVVTSENAFQQQSVGRAADWAVGATPTGLNAASAGKLAIDSAATSSALSITSFVALASIGLASAVMLAIS